MNMYRCITYIICITSRFIYSNARCTTSLKRSLSLPADFSIRSFLIHIRRKNGRWNKFDEIDFIFSSDVVLLHSEILNIPRKRRKKISFRSSCLFTPNRENVLLLRSESNVFHVDLFSYFCNNRSTFLMFFLLFPPPPGVSRCSIASFFLISLDLISNFIRKSGVGLGLVLVVDIGKRTPKEPEEEHKQEEENEYMRHIKPRPTEKQIRRGSLLASYMQLYVKDYCHRLGYGRLFVWLVAVFHSSQDKRRNWYN